MQIYFMRHGQTEYNTLGLVQGNTDIPLNSTGIAQAETARDYFAAQGISFDAVYSSPLIRAVKTAAIAADIPEEDVIRDCNIVEMGFGEAEGQMYPVIHNLFFHPEKYVAPEGGETIDEVCARTAKFLDEMAVKYGSTDKVILASTHGASLRAVIQAVMPVPREGFWRGRMDNCVCCKINYDGSRYTLEKMIYPLKGTELPVRGPEDLETPEK
ncbi:MAG: histidine phosphatase family protein [Lachnospiraceae bacterium]|nr:histidine phosphatase family protein [Lachnospiraceae bacterium]